MAGNGCKLSARNWSDSDQHAASIDGPARWPVELRKQSCVAAERGRSILSAAPFIRVAVRRGAALIGKPIQHLLQLLALQRQAQKFESTCLIADSFPAGGQFSRGRAECLL
jgi:hypothetical protein